MADVLKEFLVKLGFSIDEEKLRKFSAALVTTTKSVTELGLGVTAMATAVAAAVSITAKHFDELYYASQRTGATAEQLLRFRYAAQQVGIAANQFQGQAESLAATLRDSPPLRTWIQSVTGASGDTNKMLDGLAQWYKRQMDLGTYAEAQARSVLSYFGVDTEMVRQIAVNLDAWRQAAKDLPKWLASLGLNATQAAELSVKYERQLNQFFTVLDIVWRRLAISILPLLNKGLIELNTFLTEHLTDINDFIEHTVVEWVKWLIDPEHWNNAKTKIVEFANEFGNMAKHVDYVLEKVERLIKVLVEHPGLLGALTGAYLGGRVGGIPGAVVGAVVGSAAMPQSQTERTAKQQYEQNRPWWVPPDPVDLAKRLYDWVTGQTHSPNVEIYEARGMWSRLRDWLSGSTTAAPFVRLKEEPKADLLGNAQSTLGGAAGTSGAAPHGAASSGTRRGRWDVTGAPLSVPGGRITGNQSQVARTISDELTAKGWSQAAILGALDNAMVESGLQPWGKAGGAGERGLWQFHPKTHLPLLLKWAQDHHMDPRDPKAQADYLDEYISKHMSKYKTIQDRAQATNEFMRGFERPANPIWNSRVNKFTGNLNKIDEVNTQWPTPFKFGPHGEKLEWNGQDFVAKTNQASLPANTHIANNEGDTNIEHNPTTNIHVYGGGPNTGQYVLDAQKRLYADNIRNLANAIT